MGGRDHAHVGLDRLVAADAVELAVGQHAQQARLQFRRHVADLVQEQGAGIGLLEAAAAHRLRAGERPALVAEQLGLEQVLRDRRSVDRDERLGRARAVPVQCTRDQFLAAARLAGDQHGRMRLRQAADRAEHLLHRRRLAEDLGGGGRLFRALGLAHALVDRTPDQLDRVVDVERLGQVFERAALECGDRALEVGVGGHHDHRHLRVLGLDPLQQVQARGSRHADVADHHLRHGAVQRGQRILGRGEALELDVLSRERLFEHPADRLVVIDDPDRFHGFFTSLRWYGRRDGRTDGRTAGRRPGPQDPRAAGHRGLRRSAGSPRSRCARACCRIRWCRGAG